MGKLGEAFTLYVQPLMDETDGSKEQIEKAFRLGQICWNLAISTENVRAATMRHLQEICGMADAEFKEFQQSLIYPMMQRYHDLFPDPDGLDTQGAEYGSAGVTKDLPAWAVLRENDGIYMPKQPGPSHDNQPGTFCVAGRRSSY